MEKNRRPRPRLLLALPAAVALLLGLDAGLDLLGTWAPITAGRLADSHGILMVLGFVGALVALERAVALANAGPRLGYAAPALLSAGALGQLHPAAAPAARVALVLGALALVATYVPLWRRQRDDAVLVQALGAVLALGATLLGAGGVPVPALLPWLAGFLVLTIVGERLELARLQVPAAGATLLVRLVLAFCAGVPASLLWPRVGAALLGLTLAALAGWLLRHDVARHTAARGTGLARFMGLSMLAGQAWLAVAAALWLVGGPTTSGPAYDALVHAVFLGFTMSMVVAHAPVILPAVSGVPVPFHPVMYVPVAALQLSLVVRLWLGDALGLEVARQAGGVVNVLAVLGFLGCVAWSASRRPAEPPPAHRPAAPVPALAGSPA
ncbi:hypothetical protein [Nocardioides solisilvae]|uniref:hypothetical protein n=1 Tax=Nocardioides solisilvae TaxID=1542435 RepID=UPI000D74A2C8|nr:hypothetical protein [Nocardioides solisilvae]